MQQVNLFQEQFRPSEVPYSAVLMLIISGYGLTIGTVVTVILSVLMAWNQTALNTGQKALSDYQQQLKLARVQYPEPTVDPALLRTIESLKQDKKRNEHVLKYLDSRQLEVDHQSFSILMLALTWIDQPDLWLTQVHISEGGAHLTLTGKALNPEALPKYVAQLSSLEVFTDMKFKLFDMQRDDPYLSFVLSSQQVQPGAMGLEQFSTQIPTLNNLPANIRQQIMPGAGG